MLFDNFIRTLFHFILPASCLLCGSITSAAEMICPLCQKLLPILPHSCYQCAQTLTWEGDDGKAICGACLSDPPPYERVFACFPYKPPVVQFILNLKFKHELAYARSFGHFLLKQIQTNWYRQGQLPDLLIPVPLHFHRLRERGFNQALEIAKPIARALHLSIDTKGISRIKDTVPQSSLSAAKRIDNMSSAFLAHRDYGGLDLAIIDDVMTTGQTIRALASVLKNAGAASVDVWCVARRG